MTTFATAGAIDDTEIAASKDEILRIYQAAAHYYARIATRREVLSPAKQRIVFSIDEGPQVYVESIELRGPGPLMVADGEISGTAAGTCAVAVYAAGAALGDLELRDNRGGDLCWR